VRDKGSFLLLWLRTVVLSFQLEKAPSVFYTHAFTCDMKIFMKSLWANKERTLGVWQPFFILQIAAKALLCE
jgi:hypothetical protein